VPAEGTGIMSKGRVEAFSDGVLAIVITIMVLELKVPEGDTLEALRPVVPKLLSYLLSFVYVGIYWNNHHHLMHTVRRVTGGLLWANLHLLFWLSLFPAVTAWAGHHPAAEWPSALYGVVLLAAALSWLVLQRAIIRGGGTLAQFIGADWKGKISPALYVAGIGLSFVRPWVADACYAIVAAIWLVPDRRIEAKLTGDA
jgi:TMEM175 potassium channel family protein